MNSNKEEKRKSYLVSHIINDGQARLINHTTPEWEGQENFLRIQISVVQENKTHAYSFLIIFTCQKNVSIFFCQK